MTMAGIHVALKVGDTASQDLFHRRDDFLPYARHQLLIVAADEFPAVGHAGQIGFGGGDCARSEAIRRAAAHLGWYCSFAMLRLALLGGDQHSVTIRHYSSRRNKRRRLQIAQQVRVRRQEDG